MLKRSTPPPPKTIDKLVVSPLIKHKDSLSSETSSLSDDRVVRTLTVPSIATTNLKQQMYHDGADQRKILKCFRFYMSKKYSKRYFK